MSALSSDGRYALVSGLDNVMPGDTNFAADAYVRDLQTGTLSLVSVNKAGTGTGNSWSSPSAMSTDARYVAFYSAASDLVSNDNNNHMDVFWRDRTAGTTTLVSVNASGTGSGNGDSFTPIMTPDGRYVVFGSYAKDLVSGDTNTGQDIFERDMLNGTTTWVSSGLGSGPYDATNPVVSTDGRYVAFQMQVSGQATNVYVHDLQLGTTTLVSVNTSGSGGGNGNSTNPGISASGRYVVFQSLASNISPTGDGNNASDVFVRDIVTGTTILVSVANGSSLPGDKASDTPSISSDGRYVAFHSSADNLVSNDTNGQDDVFVRDLQANTTMLVSVSSSGGQGNNTSQVPMISADGHLVAFQSYASNLTTQSTNGQANLFVRDLVAGTTSLASIDQGGTKGGNGYSYAPIFSADDSHLAFQSDATNIVAQDYDNAGNAYVRNLATATTVLAIPRDPNLPGRTGNGDSQLQDRWYQHNAVTPDGRYVAFASAATNISTATTLNGPNNIDQIFVRDTVKGTTILVSANLAETGANNNSYNPVISANGRYVAFESFASDLVSNYLSGSGENIYLRDLVAGTTTLVSVNLSGTSSVQQGSSAPAITPDGRYVAFESSDHDLVTGDTTTHTQIFVRDMVAGQTTQISVNNSGVGLDGACQDPVITPDGRYVVFQSQARDLSLGANGFLYQLFERDRVAGTTTQVTWNKFGTGSADNFSENATVTPDGRYVAFDSRAADMVPNATSINFKVFVRDMVAAKTTLVSINSAGTDSGNNDSINAIITPNGRYVVFQSWANDLVPNDNNGTSDVFVRDLVAGTTTLVSVNDIGTGSGSGASTNPVISGDGQWVAFQSAANDLVATDNNPHMDIFLRNMATGSTSVVSTPTLNLPAYFADSDTPMITPDGQHVIFESRNSALVSGDYDARMNIFEVTNSPVTTLAVSGFTTPSTAGTASSFTVTADDSTGNPVSTYTGTVHFTSSDPQAILPSDYTFMSADAGQHSFSATLKTAGTESLTATDTVTSTITGSQSGITVNPAAAASFVIAGYPSPVTAGTSNNFTVTAMDPYGNIATGYTGTVHFTSSALKAALPANYKFTGTDAGVHSFSATLRSAGTQSITATDTGTATITGSQTGITVNPGATHHLVLSYFPSPTVAGVIVQNFRVTAQDLYGNRETGFTDTVAFTSSDGQAVLPASYTFTSTDSGVHTFSATLKTAGTQSVTVKDTTTTSVFSGTRSAILVVPAATSQFLLTGYPTTVKAGTANSMTVTVADPFGNTTPGYRGTVQFASSDLSAPLPPNYTFTTTDAGVHEFMVVLVTTGTQSVSVTDTANASITGTVSGITVVAAQPTAGLSGPSAGVPGQPLNYALTASESGLAANTVYSYSVNWGDGSPVQTLSGTSGTQVSHAYTTPGTYSVSLTATDPSGNASVPVSMSVTFSTVLMETDPDNSSLTALYVGGTSGNDTIAITPAAGGGVKVGMNFVNYGSFSPTDHVVIYGQSGNDIIKTAAQNIGGVLTYVNVPLLIFAGNGNDILNVSGSSVGNLLVGGGGADRLIGGLGPDIMIGGAGKSTLQAGSGGDILIGGTTDYDANAAALASVLAEWTSSDDYATRIARIMGSLSGGLNTVFLNGTTVHSNGLADTLRGGAGMDWFFAGMMDVLFNQKSGQTVTPIT